MSTLLVDLSDDLAARLAEASEKHQIPPAQFVREALERALPETMPPFPTDGPTVYDRMKDAIGCIDSGVTDLATNPKYLDGYGRSRR
jgi:hypothetical protein